MTMTRNNVSSSPSSIPRRPCDLAACMNSPAKMLYSASACTAFAPTISHKPDANFDLPCPYPSCRSCLLQQNGHGRREPIRLVTLRPPCLPPCQSSSWFRTCLRKLFGPAPKSPPLNVGGAGFVGISGSAFLRRRQLIDLPFPGEKLIDALSEIIGKHVSFRLVSQDIDPATGSGKLSEEAFLVDWLSKENPINAHDGGAHYSFRLALPKDFGLPAAVLVVNRHPNEFRLDYVNLSLPGHATIHFPCYSWIYNNKNYDGPRIFFSNQVCLPNDTPAGLKKLRAKELQQLQGNGTGKRRIQDRIYDYDVYNDLGNPDLGKEFQRPTLGGSKEYPYPRRCRTGCNHTPKDRTAEKLVSLPELIYVPRDEVFSNIKQADFIADSLKSLARDIIPTIESLFDKTDNFNSMEEIYNLYQKGLDMSQSTKGNVGTEKEKHDTLELLNELFDPSTQDPANFRFPVPQILQDNREAWELDEEFSRQTLAGTNPVVIERLQEFPPVSKLDPKTYGPPTSAITDLHIQPSLEGLTPNEALKQKRLFIVDYHDVYMPYLERINALDGKSYASRSLFFLTGEGTLKLVAIELSLPPPRKGNKSKSRVFTPPPPGAQTKDIWLWRLAKTHASINDTGYHQLISHWLRSHASMEPFVIATNRQLSALHPLYVLLKPHLKNTMHINALARELLINVNDGQFRIRGIIERAFTPSKYSMEMSSVVYKSWRFDEQALPADLIKRGMAEKDGESPHGLKLTVEDYPFAVDGLEIWSVIEAWVSEYISLYYADDKAVLEDTELQAWWKEIREVGHGDKSGEGWWPAMVSREALEEVLTTIIWVASAHHASVNFGQYAYVGFMPNKPTMGRRLIPEEGTAEMTEFESNPESFYLKTISTQVQATMFMPVMETLSNHALDEEYLGHRTDSSWSSDERALLAYERFGARLEEVEKDIERRNSNPGLKNRRGAVKVPYTLLFPSSGKGLTGRGIPNSISI